MTRRLDIGPLLVALGAIALLVSLFLDWYGDRTAWDAFELTDVLLAALALAALVTAAGMLVPEAAFVDRRLLPWLGGALAFLFTPQLLTPPPAAGGADPQPGAWIAFAGAMVMLAGAVVSLGRVSFSVAIEGRDTRRRVAAVDNRQPTTESGAVVAGDTTASEPTAGRRGNRG